MTFRLYEQLETSLENEFTLNLEEPQVVKGIYPYLYLKNAPAGTFAFTLEKFGFPIYQSFFTSDDIKASLDSEYDSAYVFFPILPNPYLLLGKGRYKAKLTASGYSPSEHSHLGWIKIHNNPVNELSYVPEDETELPMALKIKTLQRSMYI